MRRDQTRDDEGKAAPYPELTHDMEGSVVMVTNRPNNREPEPISPLVSAGGEVGLRDVIELVRSDPDSRVSHGDHHPISAHLESFSGSRQSKTDPHSVSTSNWVRLAM